MPAGALIVPVIAPEPDMVSPRVVLLSAYVHGEFGQVVVSGRLIVFPVVLDWFAGAVTDGIATTFHVNLTEMPLYLTA